MSTPIHACDDDGHAQHGHPAAAEPNHPDITVADFDTDHTNEPDRGSADG